MKKIFIMLFRVDFSKTVLEVNPDIETIEDFKDVPDRNLKYIFLVYDYESPYRKIPLSQRKEKVALMVGFKMEKGRTMLDRNARDIMNGKNRKVEKAISAFKELIYDSDRDTLRAIEELITNIREEIRAPSKGAEDMKRKAALAKELTSLSSTKKQLAQILDVQESDIDDDEEEKISVSTLELLNGGLI